MNMPLPGIGDLWIGGQNRQQVDGMHQQRTMGGCLQEEVQVSWRGLGHCYDKDHFGVGSTHEGSGLPSL